MLAVPKTTKSGKAKQDELPSTLARSEDKAQRTFANAHDSAAQQYGEGERAHRVAYSAVKHSYEKVGGHWEPKDGKGPSDKQAEQSTPQSRNEPAATAGGVDANASKEHLYQLAQRLDVQGRSRMSKDELVTAIQQANDRETAKARQH